MATTLTLQNSINFVRPILKMQPLNVTVWEPALTGANIILQTILAAPFKWRFNRRSFNFPVTGTATDYTEVIADLGFIETQWLTDSTGYVYELSGGISIPVVADVNRPDTEAPQFDDNAGNITWRIKPKPDASYTVFINYQAKAQLITNPASPWGVVPDEFSFVFNLGFLTLMALLINDSRFPIFEQWFISRLLGVQDGLTEQEKVIFIGNWTALMATLSRSSGAVQSGLAGRSK
jgi:hypothetical protein